MISHTANPDFSTLLNTVDAEVLLQHLVALENEIADANGPIQTHIDEHLSYLARQSLCNIEALDRKENSDASIGTSVSDDTGILNSYDEQLATSSLMTLFDRLFASQQVKLVRSGSEPEYIPADNTNPARIEFAHGFFASALHEVSHWCIAGERRRQLPDFGYWYAPDGRSAAQQHAFECLEIKPQALECLFTLACRRPFQVSQDNLFADFDTSASTFTADVYRQAAQYLAAPKNLPRDAKTLLRALLTICIIK
ncbi:elongation factor P hydroxylase [Psychrobacter sp. PL19]|uniref:elongation factor P hydroxylase n=1 Tax=Psychrobacter sp. PL19 TaxID=2760711 RepID=UPI001AE16101